MGTTVPQRPFHAERAWETSAGASGLSFLFRFALTWYCQQVWAHQRPAMPSPNTDTRTQVVVAYQGHPVFVCAQCATVIVRGVFICAADAAFELTVVVAGAPRRANQQGVFWSRWAGVVSVFALAVALGLELSVQSHAICDEYQIGQQRREGSFVSLISSTVRSCAWINLGLTSFAGPGRGYTRWRTFTASDATTVSDGTISRHRTTRRNTRKVSLRDLHPSRDPQATARQVHAGKREAGQGELLAGRRTVESNFVN